MKDFYKILNVEQNASEQEIKKAYRKLAMEYHPDRNSGVASAEEKFKEISEAYSVLSDKQKRQQYDLNQNNFNGANFDFNMGGFGFKNNANKIDDLINEFFRGGGRGTQSPFPNNVGFRASPGEDIKCKTVITLEEVLTGTEKEISTKRNKKCNPCKGSGAKSEEDAYNVCKKCGGTGKNGIRNGAMHIITTCNSCLGAGKVIVKPCDSCKGKGIQVDFEKIKVKIPAGIQNGNILRMVGQGHESFMKNGPAGDLFLKIFVEKHDLFVRDGNNLLHEMTIPFVKAVLGGEITIPILSENKNNNSIQIVLEAGTNDGNLLEMEDMGVPDLHSPKKGKQIIRFFIEVPDKEKLSTKQKDLLRQFEETFNE